MSRVDFLQGGISRVRQAQERVRDARFKAGNRHLELALEELDSARDALLLEIAGQLVQLLRETGKDGPVLEPFGEPGVGKSYPMGGPVVRPTTMDAVAGRLLGRTFEGSCAGMPKEEREKFLGDVFAPQVPPDRFVK